MAYALDYLEGRRVYGPTWEEIEAGAEHTNSQRSTALGTATHTVGEHHYLREDDQIDWSTLPAQIYHSGMHILPDREECIETYVEAALGKEPMPEGASKHAPKTRMKAHGVWFAGYKDLVARATTGEMKDIGLKPGLLMLIDYKTSGNMSYALDSRGLHDDVACNLYAIDCFENIAYAGEDSLVARWAYMETKKVRRATPVDTTIHEAEAYRRLEEPAALARSLDTMRDRSDATPNTGHCGAYGGCPHQKSMGGTCDTRRPVGRLIRLSGKTKPKKKTQGSIMTTALEQRKAEFAAKRKALADSGASEPKAETETKAPSKRKPRPSRKKAAPPEGDIMSLAQELTDAQAALATAQESVRASRAKIRDAMGEEE